MSSSKKNLIVQYYTIKSSDDAYRIQRQEEINKCLLYNVQNKYLDEIHLLTEEHYDLDFIPTDLKHKINQTVIHTRLTYKIAFDYYNTHIPDTICMLANADIFTDESIEILYHINFENSVLALNRYEFDSEERASLQSGCEINRDFPILFPNYGPSIWSQDAWVWKTPSFNMSNVDFVLGSWGCDIKIAYLLHNAHFIVYNPSFLLSVNHFDRLSYTVDDNGILKGVISSLRDPPTSTSDYASKRLFLRNEVDVIDRYTVKSEIILENKSSQAITSLKTQKSIHEILYEASASSEYPPNFPKNAAFAEDGYWQYNQHDELKYLECKFDNIHTINVIEITGKPCSRNDLKIGHISKLRISYCIDNEWIDYPFIMNGISRQNGNFIKRNYLLAPFQCIKCRIYCIESSGIPSLKVRFLGTVTA